MHSFKNRPLAFVLVMVMLAASSALGLAAMSGWARSLFAPPLSASMIWSDFSLPQGFGVEPQTVSDFLVSEMQKRTVSDVALRITLGNDGRQKLHDVAIPRLINAGVIRNMIAEVQPLSDVLAVGRFQSYARILVSNDGGSPLNDVAITLPGALRAETSDGAPIKVLYPDSDAQALALDSLEPYQTKSVTVWFDRPADFTAPAAAQIRLGAADLQNGIVSIYGDKGWPGADLEVLPWARWLIAALLTITGAGALFALVIAFAPALFRKKTAPRLRT